MLIGHEPAFHLLSHFIIKIIITFNLISNHFSLSIPTKTIPSSFTSQVLTLNSTTPFSKTSTSTNPLPLRNFIKHVRRVNPLLPTIANHALELRIHIHKRITRIQIGIHTASNDVPMYGFPQPQGHEHGA
ncbi:hypothetical protein PanWU01x14_289010 [Parasponia andersonii]|uniref:Uncharacterized protein n=1 Tax=Parasponia andersonii TaxID=3476 RepID=A0A2P5AYF3_PARAD|nr:hypothetical protein PanWU01x14_289010 [Parasponia andersonii]